MTPFFTLLCSLHCLSYCLAKTWTRQVLMDLPRNQLHIHYHLHRWLSYVLMPHFWGIWYLPTLFWVRSWAWLHLCVYMLPCWRYQINTVTDHVAVYAELVTDIFTVNSSDGEVRGNVVTMLMVLLREFPVWLVLEEVIIVSVPVQRATAYNLQKKIRSLFKFLNIIKQ